MEPMELKGQNGTFIITDTGVIIKKGIKGFFLGGGKIRGDKTIPYASIMAVQFKKAGMVAGYLHLTLIGGMDAGAGLFEMVKDENTITFQMWGDKNKKFEEGKNLIEQKMMEAKPGSAHHKSEADDLEKFAQLRDKGIITEDEFQKKKKQLLGL
jgi:hypothetical protein